MEKVYWTKVKTHKLKNTPYTLTGYSVSARNTGFYIPELRLALDCGVPSNYSPEHIFITHGHLDHCGCLPNVLIDMGAVNPIIIAPEKCAEYLKNYIHSTFVMTKNNVNPKIHNKYKLISAINNNFIDLKIKKMNYKIEVINSFHTVPCVSYGFIEIRNKLKQEYKDNSQHEIEELKKNNITITESIEIPQFCYIGDTSEKILDNTKLQKYPTIIIECTFIYEDHISNAKKDRHMHWTHLEPYIKNNPNTHFIIIHFSSRYSDEEIIKFFADKKYDNITIWI